MWPLHGVTGSWGGIACGIFGQKALGGMGGVSFISQLVGTVTAIAWALAVSSIVYSVLKAAMGIRLSSEEEERGADLSIHQIGAYPEHRIR